MVIQHCPILRLQSIGLTGLVLASIALAPASAPAQMFFASGGGPEGPVSGAAFFTVATDSITISLSNLLSNTDFRYAGQALSDVSFTLSNTISQLPAARSAGSTINIGADGSATSTGVTGNPNGWHLSRSGSSYDVTALNGGVAHLMIAPGGTSYPNIAAGGTSYPNTSPSVQSFNSYYHGSATILISGVTIPKGTTVSDVVLSFGTGPDTMIAAGGQTIATATAPPSIVMAINCVVALACFGLASSSRMEVRPSLKPELRALALDLLTCR